MSYESSKAMITEDIDNNDSIIFFDEMSKEMIQGRDEERVARLKQQLSQNKVVAYVLEYVDSPAEGDICSDCLGCKIYVDPKSCAYIQGMTIDYVRNGLNEGCRPETRHSARWMRWMDRSSRWDSSSPPSSYPVFSSAESSVSFFANSLLRSLSLPLFQLLIRSR